MLDDKLTLQTKLTRGIERVFALIDTAIRDEHSFDAGHSGSTLTLVFIVANRVYCAWVGDSRASLVLEYDNALVFDPISNDHKPSLPDEKARILSRGGNVHPSREPGEDLGGPDRVWHPHLTGKPGPGLMMSRSLGDFIAKEVGVISVPDITKREIQANFRFIVIASDGLWEVLDEREVILIVRDFLNSKNPRDAALALVSHAQNKWRSFSPNYIDDISVVVIFLTKK